MKTFKVSKDSQLTLSEKFEAIRNYDVDDLLRIQEEYESYPEDFEKEVIIEVHNNLFAKGVTIF